MGGVVDVVVLGVGVVVVVVLGVVPPPAAWTAAKAFTRPAPVRSSMPGASTSVAVLRRIALTSAGVSPGLRDSISATMPATFGVADDVPPKSCV